MNDNPIIKVMDTSPLIGRMVGTDIHIGHHPFYGIMSAPPKPIAGLGYVGKNGGKKKRTKASKGKKKCKK